MIECYCFVAGTSGTISGMVKLLHEAKRKLLPTLDPSSWSVHESNMFPQQERLRYPRFASLSDGQIRIFFVECAAAIRAFEKSNWNTSGFWIPRPRKDKKDRRRKK